MHPAFSVIFFTVMSGAGYGVWFWLGVMSLEGHPLPRPTALILLAIGFAMTSLGLLSSTLHLGKPLRAWRAFSQWRSSWLSREGVLALTTLLPALGFAWALGRGQDAHVYGALLAAFSLATVACTAMIYAALRPIPAWRHPLVLPVYLLFALHLGGMMTLALLSATGTTGNMAGFAVLVSAFLLWVLKRLYWRAIDRVEMPAGRASALGLPANRNARVFEPPHTEANYLTREMGFVLARKHSRRLRVIAVVLFADVPALCALPVWLLPHVGAAPWLAAAAVSALAGAFIERWLFFAEARHVVTLYY